MFLCGEADNVGYGCALAAALATETIRVGTNVSLALARSPMQAAMEAHGLAQAAPGRSLYGLSSQIRQVTERRFGADWYPPVGRMEEYVEVMRRAGRAIRGHEVESFEGSYYEISQFTFHSVAEPDLPEVPILLGAVGPKMLALAARAYDGVLGHGVATPRYLREFARPAVGSLPLYTSALASVAADRDRARDLARWVVGFYATTPNFQFVFELEERPEMPQKLRRLMREGKRDEMRSLIDDDLLDKFILTGTPEQVAEQALEYEDVLDGLLLGGVGVGVSRDDIVANNRGLVEVVRAFKKAS
jgi:alkanesulfonate monooxygenase SsuD/methylene tetrahydromethanopterin reductase-like flavin-dependent oxidoreductase (luciferase family)